jgi:3-phosphoshikimate 1-carboxyvinyltransferase
MRLLVAPGARLRGEASVPGDKSIAHRWLLLAALARGRSRLEGVPLSLDVRSTAGAVAALLRDPQVRLEGWSRSTATSGRVDRNAEPGTVVEVEGRGGPGLGPPRETLDCGNSGTTLRLVAGIAARLPGRTVLDGDASLRRRPMERVAEPLRLMGATIRTRDGRAPLEIEGGALVGVHYACPVPSAQVKSAVLLAGLAAEGETVVTEPAPTRDHTERALEALGAPVRRTVGLGEVAVRAFEPSGFSAGVPGDPSAAAFLLGAAAITGGGVTVEGVGLNETRGRFLAVMERLGASVRTDGLVASATLGEPVGSLAGGAGPAGLRGASVPADELPLVIDEVPVLAAMAAHAEGESRFEGGGELRVKESDRLTGLAEGLRGLGGEAGVEGDALVVGGGGLAGGRANGRSDHRLAMALAVAALGARGPSVVDGIGWAAVSFPGFVEALTGLGARVEIER